MKYPAHLVALACLSALCASQLFSQVLTKTNSGLTTPEFLQVNSTAAGAPYFGISSLSAQDVTGDGKIDLLVSGPNPTGNTQPRPITTTLLQNAGNENFTQIFGNNSSYCQPAFQFIGTVAGFCQLADLNGDGMLDKIFAVETPNYANSDGVDVPDAYEVDYPEIKVQLATGPGTYGAVQKYVLGGKAEFISAITTGDFNGDGRTDIAVLLMPQTAAGGGFGQLVILFGNGEGDFTKSPTYTTTTSYFFNFAGPPTVPFMPALPYLKMVALDLNGDGKSDLIVYTGADNVFSTTPSTDPIDFYFGTSNGLSAQPSIPASFFSLLVPANIQGEGLHDLVALEFDGTVHVLLWGGPNSSNFNYFKSDQQLPLNEYEPLVSDIAVADLNGDGRVDIIVHTAAMIDIYLQAAGSSFSAPKQYPSSGPGGPAPASNLAVADFNGDGHLDIAAGSNPLNIYYGDGKGSFTAPAVTTFSVSPALYSALALTTADFNRDGHADIAATATLVSATNIVSVFLGSGAGWFQAPKNYAVSTPTPTIAAGDVNGDGIPDLVTIDTILPDSVSPPYTGPDTNVLLGQPGGTFALAKGYRIGVYGRTLILRDVNNDGKLDMVTQAGVALGNGNGTFATPIPFPINPGLNPVQIAVGDFNHDGKLDVLYSESSGVSVLLGDGTGHFTLKQTLTPPCGEGCNYPVVAVGNLNGDSNLDFAAGVSTTLGSGIVTYLGNGDGTFQAGSTVALPSFAGISPAVFALSIQDLNGDGTEDLVAQTSEFAVLLGKGGGNFAAPLTFPSDGFTQQAVFADFNSDGALDMALNVGNGFARLLNTGFKTWPQPSSLPTAPPLQTSASTVAAVVEER